MSRRWWGSCETVAIQQGREHRSKWIPIVGIRYIATRREDLETIKFGVVNHILCRPMKVLQLFVVTCYGLDDRGVGVQVPVGLRIFTSPNRPDRLWGPPNLLSNGYRGLSLREQSGRGVKLTNHLQLVPRSRKCGSIHPLPYTPSWCSA
jgi:hypothetical protein